MRFFALKSFFLVGLTVLWGLGVTFVMANLMFGLLGHVRGWLCVGCIIEGLSAQRE
jgi:hypothetical protein